MRDNMKLTQMYKQMLKESRTIPRVGDSVYEPSSNSWGKVAKIVPAEDWQQLKKWDDAGWLSDKMYDEYEISPNTTLYAVDFATADYQDSQVYSQEDINQGHLELKDMAPKQTKYDKQFDNDGSEFSIVEYERVKRGNQNPWATTSTDTLKFTIVDTNGKSSRNIAEAWAKSIIRSSYMIDTKVISVEENNKYKSNYDGPYEGQAYDVIWTKTVWYN